MLHKQNTGISGISWNISFSRSLKQFGLFSDQHAIHRKRLRVRLAVHILHAGSLTCIHWRFSYCRELESGHKMFHFWDRIRNLQRKETLANTMDEPSMNTKTTAIFRKHDLINSGLVNNSWQFCKFPSLEKNTCQLPRDAHLRSCGPNGWLLLRRACSNYQGCHLRELMMIFYPRQNGWKKEMFYWKKPTIR